MKVDLSGMTICAILQTLHVSAEKYNMPTEMLLIEHAYIMAKKMNKKLCEYKYGLPLPDMLGNSWKEEDWVKEIKTAALKKE